MPVGVDAVTKIFSRRAGLQQPLDRRLDPVPIGNVGLGEPLRLDQQVDGRGIDLDRHRHQAVAQPAAIPGLPRGGGPAGGLALAIGGAAGGGGGHLSHPVVKLIQQRDEVTARRRPREIIFCAA